MMHRPRLTYANVTATLALFIALGGSSYAVTQLPRNSVGTKQLKRGAVTSDKVAAGAIGRRQIASDALITRQQLGSRGPIGPVGSQGPAGPLGPVGPSGPPGGVIAPESWKPLPFSGSWTNYGSGYANASYRKDQLGRVHLRGRVTKSVGAPAEDDEIAVLPADYSPLDLTGDDHHGCHG